MRRIYHKKIKKKKWAGSNCLFYEAGVRKMLIIAASAQWREPRKYESEREKEAGQADNINSYISLRQQYTSILM